MSATGIPPRRPRPAPKGAAERGASRRADVDPAFLEELNAGRASARTLTEALAVDHTVLLDHAVPGASPELRAEIEAARELGSLARMRRIGEALAGSLSPAGLAALAAHPSDTVRGWACFALASAGGPPAELLARVRPLADDPHFAVREWVWMAARPVLVAHLDESIALLSAWTADPSERVRRFASEALRPRGVWAPHIADLLTDPGRGLALLEPLRADPSRSVQDSVANWINDAAKSRPDWARELCARWLAEADPARGAGPATERIVSRGLRTIGPVPDVA